MAGKKRVFWGILTTVIFFVFAFNPFSGFLRRGIQETRESRTEASSERFAIGGEQERIQSRKQARDNKSSDVQDEVLNYRLQSSERIKQVQTALKNAGFYKGPIDGRLGPRTKEAVRNFQKANGLSPDGVAGKQTREKLKIYLD